MDKVDRLIDAGYDDIPLFVGCEYDDAIIGVTTDGRAVYEFEKMVDCLMNKEGWSDIDAIEWIEYNTIRALPYLGQNAPIIMYSIEYM